MQKLRIFLQDNLTSFRAILLGFILLILAGGVLLSLPVSSAAHKATPFLDSLFTSTSAACVTGLVVRDTATYWSLFGKTVILILIQIGGLGIITVTIAVLILTKRTIGVLQRTTMQESISAPNVGGIIRFTVFFLKCTLIAEALGALALMPVFCRDFGMKQGIGYAVFHSISAFCNAGFDLMGVRSPYSSLTSYATDGWVVTVISLLIISGGIGFVTWEDLKLNSFRFRKLRMQTKIILAATAALLMLPFLYFYFVEFRAFPGKERFLFALFQTVTPRTAGFNTFDYAQMSEGGQFITVILMMIGGAPGSTAGGLKVTTAAVIFLTGLAGMKRNDDVNSFRRRIDDSVIRSAFTLLFVYGGLLCIGSVILSHIESLPIIRTMFECASALGTVGLTTGITTGLGTMSRIILITFMFLGRTGGLTLAYASLPLQQKIYSKYPAEKIAVG